MIEISDMDWAQYVKMDYGQNLRKYHHKISTGYEYYLPISQFYRTDNLQQFHLICSKLAFFYTWGIKNEKYTGISV